MIRVASAIVLLAAISIPQEVPNPDHRGTEFEYVTAKHDDLEATTSYEVTVPLKIPGSRPTLYVHFACVDAAPCAPAKVSFMVSVSNDEWEYIKYHPVILAPERGAPIKIEGEWDGDVGNGYVLEFITFRLSAEDFDRLASSVAVRGRIGLQDFRLEEEEMAALRALNKRLKNVGRRGVPVAKENKQ